MRNHPSYSTESITYYDHARTPTATVWSTIHVRTSNIYADRPGTDGKNTGKVVLGIVKLVSKPISDGIGPEQSFRCNHNVSRPVSMSISVASVPERLLRGKFGREKWDIVIV